MQFVDREGDLQHLEDLVKTPGPVLYRLIGRRRIGKTALLDQVLRNHQGVYLFAPEGDESRVLSELRRQAAQESHEEVIPPEGWEGLYRFLERFEGRPVVIDEFQHVIESSRIAVSLLQDAWDRRLQKGDHKLFLCGSSIGMMRRLTESKAGPLYGRLTHDRRLGPFRFNDVMLLYPRLRADQVLERYAVFGGTPAYHRHCVAPPGGKTPSLEDAIRRSFLDTTAPFREEPMELLRYELKKPGRYQGILESIGKGYGTLSEIAERLSLKSTDITRYMEYLRDDLGLITVQRRMPHWRKNSRYVFSDPFFAFYYSFVSPQTRQLERGHTDLAWKDIEREVPSHIAKIAETLLVELFDTYNGSRLQGIPIRFKEAGPWWGPYPGDRSRVEEIDLVAVGPTTTYVAEIKWRKKPIGASIWSRLEEKIQLMQPPRDKPIQRIVVSKKGFTPTCEQGAPEGSLLLTGDTFLRLLLSGHDAE